MASRGSPNAGTASKVGNNGKTGKVGRNRTDSVTDGKQRKLDLGKSVKFKDEEEMKKNIESIKDELKEMKEQISKEVGKIEEVKNSFAQYVEEMKGKEGQNEERLREIERKLIDLENRWIGWLERSERGENRENVTDIESESEEQRSASVSRFSNRSRWGSSYAGSSVMSEDRLSNREVGKLKRWIKDKEKEDRRNNVAIKGLRLEDDIVDWKVWVQNFLLEKLGVKCVVSNVRKSGAVIIVKLEYEDKREVMKNKYKLKGGNVFIENDLTWEERKVQEEMRKWANEKRSKGEDIKVGYARVRIKGIWKAWTEIEKDMRKEEVEKERQDENEGREGQSFV